MRIPLRQHWAEKLRAIEVERQRLALQAQEICHNLVLDAGGPKEYAGVVAVVNCDEPYLVVTPKPETTSTAADPPKKPSEKQPKKKATP